MPINVDIINFLHLKKTMPIIDVRSPGEYAQGHIPDAINLPLFDDNERAEIGKTYFQKSKSEAYLLALEIIGPQLKKKIIELNSNTNQKKLIVYCWRGGMRSASMSWLFELFGYETFIIKGGYKSYRRHIRKSFNQKANFIVIGGMTGSGKTEILEHLASSGHQVLNLEKLAQHKGSAFGSIGMGNQPTNEQFENNLFECWQLLDLSKTVFIEDESFLIGKVQVPNELYEQMQNAPLLEIKINKEFRINKLVNEYATCDNDLLKDGITRISKRLGGLNTKNAISAIDKGQFSLAADILLQYYDKSYIQVMSKRDSKKYFSINLSSDDVTINLANILQFINENKINGAA